MNVYLISGIGANHTLFKHIKFPSSYYVHYIDWIQPYQNESLKEYSKRLSVNIDSTQPFILVGLSLGGIVAIEIAKWLDPVATIVLGTIPLSAQLPPYYRIARKIGILRIIPPVFFKITATCKRLVARESLADKVDMLRMIWQGSSSFIAWEMRAVLCWQNNELPSQFYHLHGTSDEVFPIRYVKPTYSIHGGSHMLVLSHPEEVNDIINSIVIKFQ